MKEKHFPPPVYVYVAILLACLAVGVYVWSGGGAVLENDPILPAEKLEYVSMRVGDAVLRAEVVRTDQARQKGLSGREVFTEGTGMLFVFPKADTYGIWMKDMLFSIDIIWLNEELRVVHIVENATPESFPTAFRPRVPAGYVLEVPAGFVARYGLQVGQEAVVSREGTKSVR